MNKGEGGPCVPKLHEEFNDSIVLYIIFFVFLIHLMDGIDVIVSCMIFMSQCVSLSCCIEIALAWRQTSKMEHIVRIRIVYESFPGVGMPNGVRYSNSLFHGFNPTSVLFLFPRHSHYLIPSP